MRLFQQFDSKSLRTPTVLNYSKPRGDSYDKKLPIREIILEINLPITLESSVNHQLPVNPALVPLLLAEILREVLV